jgi:hypothetical protein
VDPTTLDPLASRYISASDLPWKPTGHPGVEMKVLLEDKESELLTALCRWQPGAVLPLHEHVEIESPRAHVPSPFSPRRGPRRVVTACSSHAATRGAWMISTPPR